MGSLMNRCIRLWVNKRYTLCQTDRFILASAKDRAKF